MMLITKKKLEVPRNPSLNCKAYRNSMGYLGYVECDTLKYYKLTPTWEAKFPAVDSYCGYKDPDVDIRCAVPVPGFHHPHVVMVNDYFYTMRIDAL